MFKYISYNTINSIVYLYVFYIITLSQKFLLLLVLLALKRFAQGHTIRGRAGVWTQYVRL